MKSLLLLLLFFTIPALADTTSGGVTWTDTTVYQKPAFYPITYGPVEATSPNKYWVDLGSGSGTTCTSGSPCTFTTAQGKSFTGGGFIYIRGSGAFGSPTIVGSAGNEIIVKPWNNSTAANFNSGRNNITTPMKYVIFDGGPNQQISFTGTSGMGQFDPILYWDDTTLGDQDHITFYRVHFHIPGQGEQMAIWGDMTNLQIINSEFEAIGSTDTTDQHHIYISGCGGTNLTISGLRAYNNIFHDEPGESFELRIVNGTTFSDAVWQGNAFHTLGKGTCGNSSWHCRSAITFVDSDSSGCSSTGNINAPITFDSNLVWDTGEGILRVWNLPTTAKIYSNTLYNWGQCSGSVSGIYPSAAFATFAFTSGTVPGDYKDNVIYATGSTPNCGGGATARTVFSSGSASTADHNSCASGQSCGTSSQLMGAGDFYSLSTGLNFLFITSSGVAATNGTNLFSTVTTDYMGLSRPSSGAFSIGALQLGINSSLPAPSGISIQ